MLKLYNALRDIRYAELMAVYEGGNIDNAREQFPNEDINTAVLQVEQGFYQYLREVFFSVPGALYAVWELNGRYVSALRLEPYRDGLLLEALETHPMYRRRGYASDLIISVLTHLCKQGNPIVYSHVHKRNTASLQTHLFCGFRRIEEYAVYVDGTVTQNACTFRFDGQKNN